MPYWLERRTRTIEQVCRIAAAVLVLTGVIVAAQVRRDDLLSAATGQRIDQNSLAPDADEHSSVDTSTMTSVPAGPAAGGPASRNVIASSPEAASDPGDTDASSSAQPDVSKRIPTEPGAHGVTDTSIQIGFITIDVGAYNAAIGAVSGQQGDNDSDVDAIYKAVIDYVNANGGLAGRMADPVFVFQDVSQYLTPNEREREQQKVCAGWTEDNQVYAASGAGMTEEGPQHCLAEAKTPMVNVLYTAVPSEARYREISDYWYAPHGFVAEHRERALVQELASQGFFSSDAKIGLMIEDRPGIRVGVENGMKPALAALGLKPEVEIVYPDIIESPWPNYVLQLQSAGVTHVLFSATTGFQWSTLFMQRAAENQRYRPRWGIASDNGPRNLTTYSSPPEQLRNTHGMGWMPKVDTGDTTPVGPNGRICDELMRNAGQPEGAGDGVCEVLFFLKLALDQAESIGPQSLSRVMDKIGTTFNSSYTIGGTTSFSSSKHAGPAVARGFGYDERCGQSGAYCLKYVTDPHPWPE